MVYTVTLNPSLDYFVRLTGGLRPGALHRTHGEALYPGGKGVNVSLVLHTLGIPSLALGFAAGQTGALLSSLLEQAGVPSGFCLLEEGMTRINVKVCSGGQTEFNGAGPAIPDAALDRLSERLDTLGGGDWLVLSGSVPSGVPAGIYARLLRRVQGRGVKTLVDTSGGALAEALPCGPDLVKPNLDELDGLAGPGADSPSAVAVRARSLQARGARDVLVSCGAAGAVYVPRTGAPLYLPAPPGEVAQTVGAGDSMVAGWLYAQERGLDMREALRMAVAAGSAAACAAWLPGRGGIAQALARTAVPREIAV